MTCDTPRPLSLSLSRTRRTGRLGRHEPPSTRLGTVRSPPRERRRKAICYFRDPVNGVQTLRKFGPRIDSGGHMPRKRSSPLCREISIGETGFEPATARPPARGIRLRRLRFGPLEPSRCFSVSLSCAHFAPQIAPPSRLIRPDQHAARSRAGGTIATTAGSAAQGMVASCPKRRGASTLDRPRRTRSGH